MSDLRPRRLKRILVGIGELASALAFVAIFFLIVVGIYSISFPDATHLGEMIRDPGMTRIGNLDFEMEGLPEDMPFTAWLRQVRRRVKEKPADGIVWSDARSGIPLGNRHAVQSLARSGATISFSEESQLRLGANSLVVIRETRRSARSRRRTASVVVLSGELSGRLQSSGEEPLVVEIAGPESTLRVESVSQQTTEFKVTTNSDDSSTFAVYSGDARVEAGERTIELGGNQFVTIDPLGRIQQPQPLPPAPAAVSPADGTLLAFRGAPPRVAFAWEPREVDSCRFVLARDAEFQDVVHEVVTADGRFDHGGLRPGTYFWRVSGLDGAAESPASPTRRFEILLDQEPPALQVQFPDEPVEAAVLDLIGETEPGAGILVGDSWVDPDEDGSFTHQIQLQPGINVVVVEAVDPVGNTSYASSVVQARFAAPESAP